MERCTNFEPLFDLLRLLEINMKSKFQVAKNALYSSDKAIQEMIFVIFKVIEARILKEIRESSHFALMLDEPLIVQLVICGRYIDRNFCCYYLRVRDTL